MDGARTVPLGGIGMNSREKKKTKIDIAKAIFEWSESVLQAVIAVLLIFALVASVYSVRGRSMEDTLEEGQMLLVSKLFYTPAMSILSCLPNTGLEFRSKSPAVTRRWSSGSSASRATI